MKKIIGFLIFAMLTTPVFAGQDRRICDSNQDCLDVNSDGSVSVSGGTDGVAIKPGFTVTVCASDARGADLCDYQCDGTADDVQIQAAITEVVTNGGAGAAQAGGSGMGTVKLSDGTFNIASTIFLKVGVNIIGNTFVGTYLKAITNFNDNMFEFDESTTDPSAGVFLSHLFLDGNRSSNTQGSILDSKVGTVALWDLVFDHVIIFECSDTCLIIDDPWGFRFEHSQCEDSDNGCIKLTGGASKTNGASITDSKLIQVGKDTEDNTPEATIVLANIDGIRIVGNEINNNAPGKAAIEIQTGSVTGNIVGNDFTASTRGIEIQNGAAGISIIANDFPGITYTGVDIQTGSTSNIVIGNVFTSVGSGEIVDNGTTSILVGNVGDDEATKQLKVEGGVRPDVVTADPCSNMSTGSIFYNSTANVPCFCNGTDDLKISDGTACFP